MYWVKLGNRKINVESLMPLFCALVAYKEFYNYYIFIVPSLEFIFVGFYNAITLFCIVMFVVLSITMIPKSSGKHIWPALVIPLCVVINIAYVAIESKNISIIGRTYSMNAAVGTHDQYGFYSSQLIVWLSNMCIVLMLVKFIRSRAIILRCIMFAFLVMLVPTVLIVIMHPEYLGERIGKFESVSFGGGIWNIGVIGYGSLSWLAMSLSKIATAKQKRYLYSCIGLFVLVGIGGLSRTMVLIFAVSLAYYFLASKKDQHWVTKIIILISLCAVIVIIESNVVTAALARFSGNDVGTNNIRFQLWSKYSSHIGECWLFGAPEGSVYNYYHDANWYGNYYLPHSSILNYTLRFGVLAGISYLAMIKNSFIYMDRHNENERNERVCMQTGCLVYVLLAFTNQSGYEEPLFFIMFGLLLARRNIYYMESIKLQAKVD